MCVWRNNSLWRLVAAGVLLAGALACGQQSCSCAEPLDRPIEESNLIYDGAQARLTPAAFSFIEQNLPTILETLLGEGLNIPVPRTDASQTFLWFTIEIIICENGCTLQAEIVDTDINPVSPNKLQIDAHINLRGTITINGTFDCDVPIDIKNKPVHADVYLLTDTRDRLAYVDVGQVDVTITSDDYELTCDWGFLSDIGLGDFIDDVVNWIMGLLTPTLNNQLRDQLNDAVDDMVADATCLDCNYYTGGCPAGASCNNDFCMQSGTCRHMPLGMVGAIDLTEQLAALGSSAYPLEIMLAAGQQQATSVDRVIQNGGLELRMIGGARSLRHPCVPEPAPGEIPSNAPAPRLVFTDSVPGTGTGYMLGIAVSDAVLDWYIYKAHLGGMLCLSLGSDLSDMLSSGSLSLLGMASLQQLTGGRNMPVYIKFRPTRVPYTEVGSGRVSYDDQGNPKLEEPLLYLFIPGLELDFWVKIEDRWMRVLTLAMDLELDAGLVVDNQNRLVPLLGQDSVKLSNIDVRNYELLGDDPQKLKELLPSLIGMALPMLTGSLQPIELPSVQGFVMEVMGIKGVGRRGDSPYYDFLTIWANLRFQP